jgi:1,2-phenylacetyl-CoA epoxidase PaaB subunit
VNVYEVFRQERKGVAFEHAGSVAAPDEGFARAYAHEQYGRAASRRRCGSCRAPR